MAPNNTTSEEQRDRSGDRRAGAGPIIGGAVFVGIITACALVLSYHGLFQLAEYGGHEGSAFAHVFPATYALLVLMAFWASYVLRSAPPRDRLWVDVGLIPLLILAAGATMAARNLGLYDPQVEGALLSERAANVIVAVAPLTALLIAILLWITVRAHMRRRDTAPRPTRPSADRTTVLPGRRPTVEEAEPIPFKARLLDLGQSPRDEAPGEDGVETEHWSAVGDSSSDQGSEPVSTDPGNPPEPETAEGSARSEAGPQPFADTSTPAPSEDFVDQQGSAARSETAADPTASLPRRRNGGNPIKRAAEEVPVVPGASRPSNAEPATDLEPKFRPVVVPDHLSDEGFEHQPPVGDPVTDEAEAPVATEPLDADTAGAVPPPASTVPDEEDRYPASGAPTAEDDTAWGDGPNGADLWEPPTEETGGVLDDYVPPVWTPPEDNGPMSDHTPGQDEEPAPTLDHDTGPEVRAAFGRGGDVPTGAALPGSEPQEAREIEDRDGPAPSAEPVEPDEPADNTGPAGEKGTAHRTADPPRATPHQPRHTPPPTTPRSSPAALDRDAQSLDKRPMVLKPRRPPMPDLSSEPPSRQVRSEPMRPED